MPHPAPHLSSHFKAQATKCISRTFIAGGSTTITIKNAGDHQMCTWKLLWPPSASFGSKLIFREFNQHVNHVSSRTRVSVWRCDAGAVAVTLGNCPRGILLPVGKVSLLPVFRQFSLESLFSSCFKTHRLYTVTQNKFCTDHRKSKCVNFSFRKYEIQVFSLCPNTKWSLGQFRDKTKSLQTANKKTLLVSRHCTNVDLSKLLLFYVS